MLFMAVACATTLSELAHRMQSPALARHQDRPHWIAALRERTIVWFPEDPELVPEGAGDLLRANGAVIIGRFTIANIECFRQHLDDITDADLTIGKGLAKTIIDGTEPWDYVPVAAISQIPALAKLNQSMRNFGVDGCGYRVRGPPGSWLEVPGRRATCTTEDEVMRAREDLLLISRAYARAVRRRGPVCLSVGHDALCRAGRGGSVDGHESPEVVYQPP